MVDFLQHSPIVDAERNAREVMQVRLRNPERNVYVELFRASPAVPPTQCVTAWLVEIAGTCLPSSKVVSLCREHGRCPVLRLPGDT